MIPVVLLSLQPGKAEPFCWTVLDEKNQFFSSDFEGFRQWQEEQSQPMQGYLFLPEQAVSFHYAQIPEGVKRSAAQLVPVLIEEQLAQDIDQVFIHFAGLSAEDDEQVNVVVCDQDWFDGIWHCLGVSQIKWQSCLPSQLCRPDGASEMMAAVSDRLPSPVAADQLLWPDHLRLQDSGSLQFLAGLRSSRWNMIRPASASSGEVGWTVLAALIAVGVYLFNQWLG